jgi:hypothetical protein
MYFFQFIVTISKLIFISLTQLKKSETWGKQYLNQLEITYQGQFEPDLIKKVAKFQSIQLHFVANTFSGLFNRNNNKAEVERNIQYFLMTVLYDELIDENKLDESMLNEMFYQPEKATPNNFKERVLIAMHLKLLEQVTDKKNYRDTIEKVHLAQKDSAKQFKKETSIEDIIDITKRKGGYSLLMCRHYLTDPVNENIDACWYALGGLIQMTNDLYDSYKDTKEGIYTFVNKQQELAHIEMIYMDQKRLLNNSISKLPVTTNTKLKFAIKISIIPAFGDIAIQQLKGINNNSNTLPNFNQIPRKSLIIDMEKMVNRYRLIKFAYKNGKLWM